MLTGIWAAVLFTLQLKKHVINILLIVVCRFSDDELHLNGLFIETVRESISLSGCWQYLPWCCCCRPHARLAKGRSTLTHSSSSTWSQAQAYWPQITPGPSLKRPRLHMHAHTPSPPDVPLGWNWEQEGPQQINNTYWFCVIWLSGCHNAIIGQGQHVCAGARYSE